MSRITRMLLCTLFLASPSLALGGCPVAQGAGIQASSCCTTGCSCPSSCQGEPAAAGPGSSLGECAGTHDARSSDLGSATVVRASGDEGSQRSQALHPADMTPAVALERSLAALDPGVSVPPATHRHPFEFFCAFLL